MTAPATNRESRSKSHLAAGSPGVDWSARGSGWSQHDASPDGGARSRRAGGQRWLLSGMPSRAGVLVFALVALLLAGWGMGEVSRSALQASDLDVVRDVARQRTALLTLIAHALSWAGSGFLIAPAAVMSCVALCRSGRLAAAGAVALSCVGAGVIMYLDKLIVGRPRPAVEHLETATHASFPSGHATLSTAFCLMLLIVFAFGKPPRTRRAAAIAAALLIGGIAISRVYLGVHYPTDVAGGIALGAAWTLIVASRLRQSASGGCASNERPSGLPGKGEPPRFESLGSYDHAAG